MSSDPLSQTGFSQELPTVSPMQPVEPASSPAPKKNAIVPIAILASIIVLVGMVVLVLIARRGGGAQQVATPTPLPSQSPVETDQIRKDIEVDLQAIDASNPESDENPFPPVDFTVRITEPK